MATTKLQQGERQTRLENESAEYISKRNELRQAELDEIKVRERVAELRRRLPQGATVADYKFIEGPADLDAGDAPTRSVSLSELFTGRDRSVVIYQFMYGKLQTKPCPMCTHLIDGLNGVANHLAQNLDLAIVAAADPVSLRNYARSRGWRNLRMLSTDADSTFKYDFGGEDREGNQDSTLSVFIRDEDGKLRHFYTSHPHMAADVKERGLDLLSPVYNMLDLTPQGRGDWYASLSYGATVRPGTGADTLVRIQAPASPVK